MATEIFNIAFIEYVKIFVTAILIYAIIFALLRKLSVLGEDAKIDSLIALLTAVIVSFSGVATYAISYAINWFVIVFFIAFLIIVLLLFLGVKMGDVTKTITKNMKPILIAFGILFGIVLIKSFFALNNTFDTNEPTIDPYEIDASFNTGVDDITNKEIDDGWFSSFWNSIDSELLGAVLFLIALGIFVIILGK